MKTGKKSKYLLLILFIFSFGMVLLTAYWTNMLIEDSLNVKEYNIEKRMNITAELLAKLISAEELDQFRYEADMELPAYQALRKRLLEFSEATDVLYAYFIRARGEYLYYIVDNDFDEETMVGLNTPPFTIYEEPSIRLALEGNTINTGLGNYSPDWDGLLTSYAPVFRPDGTIAAIAGVDIDDTASVWARNMLNILTAVQFILVAIVFASGLIAFVLLRREADVTGQANVVLEAAVRKRTLELEEQSQIAVQE
jgi:hypothetical protein